MRKVIMKVLTNWLSKILAKHYILKENNFVDLSSDSTEAPIKIIMIIKYAKFYKCPLWILL